MWQKYVTRRLAVQVAQAWNFGWGKIMKEELGVCLMNTLVFRDHKKTEYYVDRNEFKNYIRGLQNLLDDKLFINNFLNKARFHLEKILKQTKKDFSKLDFSILTNKELLCIYENKILPNINNFYIWMWTVFNIGQPLANKIKFELKKKLDNQNEINKYLLMLSSPLEPNDVMKERIDLLIIALESKNKDKDIVVHTKKYQHIPMFDFDHDPYTKNYFINELKSINNAENELAEIKNLYKERKKYFRQAINNLNPNKKFINLINFLKECVILRDYRDMLRQKYNLELRKFYKEVAKRLDLNIEQVATLTNKEIIKCLKNKSKFSIKEVKRREEAYLLIQKTDNISIYSGNKAKEKALKELKIKTLARRKTITGRVGSIGKTTGCVKIVLTNKDLSKVKEGDVLVSAMTRQDFITAIRRSSAIITDEGGITCHAAIIARELKKPCIIGTKIATKVLKDGDKVLVDADKGIVKKL